MESPCHKGTELRRIKSGEFFYCVASGCKKLYNGDGSGYVEPKPEPELKPAKPSKKKRSRR